MQSPDSHAPIPSVEDKYQALLKKISEEYIDLITAEIFFDPYVMDDGDSIEKEAFDALVIDVEKKKEQEKKEQQQKKEKNEIQLLHPGKRIPIAKIVYPNNHLKKTIAHLLQSQPALWVDVYVPQSLKINFAKLIDGSHFESLNKEIIKHPRLLIEKMSDKHNAITYLELICIKAPSEALTKIIQTAVPFKILIVNYFKSDGVALYKILFDKKDFNNIKILAELFAWQSSFYLERIYKAAETQNFEELVAWRQLSNMTLDTGGQIKIIKYAFKSNNVSPQIVKILLEQFKLTEERIHKLKNNILHELIQEKAEAQVKFVLLEGADALALNELNETAFHVAIKYNSPAILKMLLADAKINDDFCAELLSHLLIYAIQNNNIEMMELLLEHGADPLKLVKPLILMERPISAVSLAARVGNEAIIKILSQKIEPYQFLNALLESGGITTADIKRLERLLDWDKEFYQKQAWHAIDNRGRDVLKLCCESGIDLNMPAKKKMYKGNTLLHAALIKGYDGGATVLLDAGALIDIKNRQGNTALHCAAKAASEDVLRTIIAKSPDQVREKNKNNQYPIDIAIAEQNKINEEILKQYFNPSEITQPISSPFPVQASEQGKQQTDSHFIQSHGKTLLQLQRNNKSAQIESNSNNSQNSVTHNNVEIAHVTSEPLIKNTVISLLQKRADIFNKLFDVINKNNSKNSIYAIQLLRKMNVCTDNYYKSLSLALANKEIAVAKEAAISLVQLIGGRLHNDKGEMNETQSRLDMILAQIDRRQSIYNAEVIVFIAGQFKILSKPIIATILIAFFHLNQKVRVEAEAILKKIIPICKYNLYGKHLEPQLYKDFLETHFASSMIFVLEFDNDHKVKELLFNSIDMKENNAEIIVDKLLFQFINNPSIDKRCRALANLFNFMALSKEIAQLIFLKLNTNKELVIDSARNLLLQKDDQGNSVIVKYLKLFDKPDSTAAFLLRKIQELKESDKVCNAISALANYDHIFLKPLIGVFSHNDTHIMLATTKKLMPIISEFSKDQKDIITHGVMKLNENLMKIIMSNECTIAEQFNAINFMCDLCILSNQLQMSEGFYKLLLEFLMHDVSDNREAKTLHILNCIKKMPNNQQKMLFLNKMITCSPSIEMIKIIINDLRQCGQKDETMIQFIVGTHNLVHTRCGDREHIHSIQVLRCLNKMNDSGVQLLQKLLKSESGECRYFAAIALCEFNIITDDVKKTLLEIISLPDENLLKNAIKALMAIDILTADIVEQLIDKIMKSQSKVNWDMDEVADGLCRLFAPIDRYANPQSSLSQSNFVEGVSAAPQAFPPRVRP